MPLPRLYALTAQAGGLHHVYLVPPGETVPKDFQRCVPFGGAAFTAGPHFLSVRREVRQDNFRPAHDVLVLYGVDGNAVSGPVRDELTGLLPELERLVKERTTWKHQPAGHIEAMELTRWLDRLSASAGGALPLPRSWWWGASGLAALVTFMVLITVSFLAVLLLQSSKAAGPNRVLDKKGGGPSAEEKRR